MSLKFSAIVSELSDSELSGKIRIYCRFPDREVIGIKKTEELGSRYDSAFLYAGYADSTLKLRDYENLSVVINVNRSVDLESEEFENCNIIAVEDEKVFNDIIEKISFEFESSRSVSEISSHLFNVLKDGGGIQEILDYGYEKLKNPVLLVDVSFNFLGTAGAEGLNDEPVWEYTVKNGFMPNYYLNSIAEEKDADSGLFAFREKGEKSFMRHRQFSMKIHQNNSLIGYIKLLEVDNKITKIDRVILNIFADFLAIALSRRMGKENFKFSVIENFLTSILLNKITNPEEIENRMELFGIKLQEKLYVITIEMTNYKIREDKKYDILAKVKKYFDRNNVVILNNYIVVLYDIETNEEPFSEEMTAELTALLEENGCQASISFQFNKFTEFYKYYLQTVNCMQVRDILGIQSAILRYDYVIQYHMILNFSEIIDLDIMIAPAVKELVAIDRENDSDYVNTLFTYVNCQQNLSRAAEKMFLHYNTLKYRINRIIEMTGVNLNDEKVVFDIMIAERILKIKELMSSRLVMLSEVNIN